MFIFPLYRLHPRRWAYPHACACLLALILWVPLISQASSLHLLEPAAEYTCAMHPQIRSQDPDTPCPICGMTLVPVVRSAEPVDPQALVLDPRALALMNLETQAVSQGRLTRSLRLSGQIVPDEARVRRITARVSGRVDRVFVATQGAPVQKGEVLAEIYSPELYVAQEELLSAARSRARLTGDSNLRSAADKTYTAAREKLLLLGVSEGVITRVEAAGRPLTHLPIEAPIDGLVRERLLLEGDYISLGQPLFTLVDLSQVWAELAAYEEDLAYVHKGLRLSLSDQRGREQDASIDYISPWLDPLTRTASLRVLVDNASGYWHPGQWVTARLSLVLPAQLRVPASAPLLGPEGAIVFVQTQQEPASYVPRKLTLGPRAGDFYPVVSGLSEGERVVTEGALRIDSERQLRGLRSLLGEGGGSLPHDHGAAAPARQPDSGHSVHDHHLHHQPAVGGGHDH